MTNRTDDANKACAPAGPEPLLPAPFATEYCDENDTFYDYTMRPYAPRCPPAGKLASVNLLYQLLGRSRQRQRWVELIAGIRQALGRNRTVWGVKLVQGELVAELYFYFRALASSSRHREPPERIAAPITVEQVLRGLDGLLRVVPESPAHAPRIMLSLDIDDEVLSRGRVDLLHVYMNSGVSYDVRIDGIEHANHYTFFEMNEPDRLRALVEHLSNGLIHGSACGVDIQKVLAPNLYACRTICLAAKRNSDAIYFAGIDTERLLWFLENNRWPEPVLSFVERNREAFGHLSWDVGLDFAAPEGKIEWQKTGLYGTF